MSGIRPFTVDDCLRAVDAVASWSPNPSRKTGCVVMLKDGISLWGSVWVMRWFPCVECARAIAGVHALSLICSEPDWSEARYHFREARTILEEAGVKIKFLEKQAS